MQDTKFKRHTKRCTVKSCLPSTMIPSLPPQETIIVSKLVYSSRIFCIQKAYFFSHLICHIVHFIITVHLDKLPQYFKQLNSIPLCGCTVTNLTNPPYINTCKLFPIFGN